MEVGEVRDLLSALEQSLQSVQVMRDELGKQYNENQKEAKQFELDLLTDDDLRNKLERQRLLFNTVVEQLKQAHFVSDYSSVTWQVIEPPKALRRPVWPRVGPTLALALVLGGMLGMSVVMVLDRLDPTHPLAGRAPSSDRPIDYWPGGDHSQESGRRARFLRPDQPFDAPIGLGRGLPVRPDQHRLSPPGQALQVLLVTSAYADEGKTTAASNLAISFAAAGRKVLLIDADLRHPSLDPIHNVDRVQGLSCLLNDVMPLHRVVQQSRINSLDIVTAGPEVPNPAELLSSPRLAELLDEARKSYDIILVDSSPLLAVTDPAIIGAVADGIILTVRAWMLHRHDAEQSSELLQSLGTPILGLLVNGIHPGEGGYSSRNGYGYSSRNGYGGHRSDPASRLTRGEDPPPTIAARSQPQANGHTESDSHEPHFVYAAVNNVPIPDEWSTRIWLSRGADLPAPPSSSEKSDTCDEHL